MCIICLRHDTGVITRKDHKCFGCNAIIKKGTKVNVTRCVEDGQAYSIRLCEICELTDSKIDHYDDPWRQGELPEFEEWEESKNELAKNSG